jgi:hypothetical protein
MVVVGGVEVMVAVEVMIVVKNMVASSAGGMVAREVVVVQHVLGWQRLSPRDGHAREW